MSSRLSRRILPRQACATLVLIVGTLLAGAPAGAAADDPIALAHRGYPGGVFTENTIESYDRAVRAGAGGIELDVRITRDGRFVVMHDDGLGRTTTCADATVSGSTLGWINDHCRGKQRGEWIPGFGTTAGWFARHPGLEAIVELKDGDWQPATIGRLRDVASTHDVLDQMTFSSQRIDLLRRVEATAPEMRTQAISRSWAQVQDLMSTFPALDGVSLYPDDATAERVRLLHDRSWQVYTRNTNRSAEWARLREAGVDGILTDEVAAVSDGR